MGIIGKLLSTVLTIKRKISISEVKVELSKGENIQAEIYQNAGVDSKPIKDDRIYLSSRTESGAFVMTGFLDIKNTSITSDGEIRIYARDLTGVIKSFVYCKNDGTTIINGDSDNSVRYSKLQEAFNALQENVNSQIDLFTKHTHVYLPGALSPTVTAVPPIPGVPSDADIEPAKIDSIKVP